MADVTVEFGAKDLGLAKTLATVAQELTGLRTKVQSGELSMSDLEQTMRRVGQVESMEKRIKGMGTAADSATTEFKQLDAAIDAVQAEQTATGFGAITSSVGKMATAVAAGYAAVKGLAASFSFVGDAVIAASDLGETTSKVGQIFGTSAGEIEKWSKSSATALGQSSKQAMDAAATFGIFGKAAGLSGNALASFSTDLTGLATDLASFNNTSPEEAILAIGAALRGESEPIRRFGVLLDDATLKAKAMEMGIYDGKGALDLQAKSLAAYNVILDQTTTQQGDFARTADGMANQTKILTAEVENLKAELGTGLLPSATSFVSYLNKTAVPAVYGFGAALKEAGAAANSLANYLGFSDEALQGSAKTLGDVSPALKTVLGSAIPVAAAFFKAGDAIEYLAEKGREARGETEDAAKAQDDLGEKTTGAAAQLDKAALSAAAAAGEYTGLADKANNLGEVTKSTIGLNTDFKASLDGLGTGYSDMSDNLLEGKSLLESNLTLTDQIDKSTESNVQTLGKAKELLAASADLKKTIEKIDKDGEAAELEKLGAKQESLKLDRDILEAKASGNTELAESLEHQKSFNTYLNQAIAAGFGKDEAQEMANRMATAAQNAKGMKDELSASAKLMQSIADAEQKTTKAGKLESKAQQQLSEGNTRGARATADRLATEERKQNIAGMGESLERAIKSNTDLLGYRGDEGRSSLGFKSAADFAKGNLNQQAQDLGLERRLGESKKELQDRVDARLKEIASNSPDSLRPGQQGEKSGSGGNDKKDSGKNTLESLVEKIHDLVEKIEPKLPTAALTA